LKGELSECSEEIKKKKIRKPARGYPEETTGRKKQVNVGLVRQTTIAKDGERASKVEEQKKRKRIFSQAGPEVQLEK